MSSEKEKIRSFVIENFLFGDSEGLENNTSFLEEGIIDSTGVLELVAFLESAFCISVDDEELTPENFDSIDNVYSYVQKKLQTANVEHIDGVCPN